MEFLLIASAHFLALLSPGPDFFLILQASLRLKLRYGLAICVGIALANGVYLLFAIIGFEIVRQAGWLLLLLKYLGGGYLLFLGIVLLRAPKQTLDNKNKSTFLQTQNWIQQFLIGFMSAILNPKNAIFYLSLFTVMVSKETSLAIRCLYGLWMMSVVFIWDCFVLGALGRSKTFIRLEQAVFYVEKSAGLALACFGIILPFS